MKTRVFEYSCKRWTGSSFGETGMTLAFRGRHEVEACHQLKRYLRDELKMAHISVGQHSGDVDAKAGSEFFTWRHTETV